MPALYRVKLNSEHFNMVRRYMVDKDMMSAARAAEEMIEIAAAASQAASSATDQDTGKEHGAGALLQSLGGNGRHKNLGHLEDR